MSETYLYPCSCGNEISIGIGDAGSTIECDACATVHQPLGLREIKQLKSGGNDDPFPELAAPKWNRSKGTWFVIGCMLTMVAGAFAGLCFYLADKAYLPPPKFRGEWVSVEDRMPPSKTRYFEVYVVVGYTEKSETGSPYRNVQWRESEDKWVDEHNTSYPRDYFTKWSDAIEATIQRDAEEMGLRELFAYWYDPKKPVQAPFTEWKLPNHEIEARYVKTYKTYAFFCCGVGALGIGLACFGLFKK